MSRAPPAQMDGPDRPLAESANRAWLRALSLTAQIERAPERVLAEAIEEHALIRPHAPALLADDETFSYAGLAERARRYARWALAEGLIKGDTVALLARNRPDYLAAWLGLTSVGVVVALINANLTGGPLAHCLAAAAPRRVIAASDFAEEAQAAAARLAGVVPVWEMGAGEGSRMEAVLAALSADRLSPDERRGVTVHDPALLIYTSGTTGLPKAARVSHHRVMSWSSWFAGMLDARPDDRLFDCLPLYHSVGGVVATGALLVAGGSVVVAPKFSASRFWDDIVRWDCTLVQYIGELCRYLVAAPASASERAHRLRIACGNGLSASVWTAFQDRFAVPRILEFYAATEGNFSLFNVEGEPGSIGRVPGFMAHRFPATLVVFDPETGAPARGADGFCIRCPRGEAGEAIGRIGGAAGDQHAQMFEGYTDTAQSEKKVLRDVFEKDDAWVRTGDLMRIDERGFFHFVERIGDTFRWKGENVSAGEVAAVIERCPGVAAAAVYGVSVPRADGRAGMATIETGDTFDLATLREHLARLPHYARPLFLRVTPSLALTETFKKTTHRLAVEGFDPNLVDEPLFFDDRRAGAYVPLGRALFDQIAAGRIRV